jgi:hypothetical protein
MTTSAVAPLMKSIASSQRAPRSALNYYCYVVTIVIAICIGGDGVVNLHSVQMWHQAREIRAKLLREVLPKHCAL